MNYFPKIMTSDDVSSVYQLEKECFNVPWSEDSLRQQVDSGLSYFFVIKDEGRVVAYGGMHLICGEGFIDNIAVSEKYRRKGLATAILTELEGVIASSDGERLTLEVRESNTGAIKLYEDFGFTVDGIRKNYYTKPRENAVIMSKWYRKDNE